MRCFIFFILLFTLTACGNTERAGGKLPTISALPSPSPARADLPSSETPAPSEESPAPVTPDANVHTGVGDDMPVTRALTAKMMALAYFSMEEINAMPYALPFTDVNRDEGKYINAVYNKQIMLGYNNQFLPDGYLTLGQAYQLLSPDIAPPTADNIETPVSYALWVDLYVKMLEEQGGAGIQSANVIVMEASPLLTDMGAFSCEGMDMRPYLDKEIRVLHKDGEIVAVTTLVNDIPTLYNAYVLNTDKYGATVFRGGTARYYEYSEAVSPLGKNDIIGDFVIYQGKILEMTATGEKLSGTVLRTASTGIEFKEWGIIPADARFKTYSSADGDISAKAFENVLVGTDTVDFYIKNNLLCAGVIRENTAPGRIRVAIGTARYAGLIHPAVTVTADTDFSVSAGKVTKDFKAGQRFTVSTLENTDLFGQPRIFITCAKPGGLFKIENLERGGDLPNYRGTLEIAAEEGGYSIVNELPLEEYLYAVVPSEMPDGHGLEAAKAQAVTARSYAYNQFYENRFHAYGAHVDDSVNSQVYNNIPETEQSARAVNETAGLYLTYLGQVISANFYSTSAGVTANSGEVWLNNETLPYLRSQSLITDGADAGDLSVEENARQFLTDKTVQAFDSGFGWFRWEVEMTAAEIAASVNANLPGRMAATPELIIFDEGGGAQGIGELISLEVLKRGGGGNIMEMRIEGTQATLRVLSEYNVRSLICPKPFIPGGRDIDLFRHDGTYVTNYTLMPSAFFVVENGADYKFIGGGNGHGVGMSQNGAKGMADLGFKFDEILEKFYPGAEVAVVG